MKKTSLVVRKTKNYEISILINNTAYVVDGETAGLLNIKSNAFIGPMRAYYTYYDEGKKFYIQTYTDKVATADCKNLVERTLVRVYDAQEEEMLIDNMEFISWVGEYHECLIARDSDGLYHIFDKKYTRKHGANTSETYDEAAFFFKRYNDEYAVVTKNGKKGLYHVGSGLVTSIAYDNIEKMNNIIVYTSGTTKFFECDSERGKRSVSFESISLDENNNNIAYCRSGNTVYIYNTNSKDLLLKLDADEVKYVYKSGDSVNEYNGEFFFITKKDNKFGIVSSEINYNIRKSPNPEPIQRTIVNNKYDEIIKAKYANFYYIRKDDKWGLCFPGSKQSKFVEPEYDDIDYIENNIFRFYKGKNSKIARVSLGTDFTTIVDDVDDITYKRRASIFKKNDKLGLLYTDSDHYGEVVGDDYDEVEEVAEHYFIVTKDGKKGVVHLGEMIIPMKYKDIVFGGQHTQYQSLRDTKKMYFALMNENGTYELAKRSNYNYRNANRDCPVEFVDNHRFKNITFFRDIMALTDENGTLVYDYEERLLRRFTDPTQVISFPQMDAYNNEKGMYYGINNVYYFYKDGKFEEVHMEEMDCYVTTYENETESYEIKTFNKKEHDRFCSEIDGYEDDEKATEALKKYAENIYQLRNRYGSLTLSLVPKGEKK